MAAMPPVKKPGMPGMFRGGRKPMPKGGAVKSPSAQPPGRPMQGNQNPQSYSPLVMGGPTPFMQPPAGKSSLMDPSRPQASRMYADGAGGMMDDPDAIGGMPDDGSSGADTDNDGDGTQQPAAPGTPVPADPAAVNYHDEEHKCSMCAFMDPSGMCNVLQIQVSPVGGCTNFHAADQGAAGAGAPPPDNGEGPQGNPLGTTVPTTQR